MAATNLDQQYPEKPWLDIARSDNFREEKDLLENIILLIDEYHLLKKTDKGTLQNRIDKLDRIFGQVNGILTREDLGSSTRQKLTQFAIQCNGKRTYLRALLNYEKANSYKATVPTLFGGITEIPELKGQKELGRTQAKQAARLLQSLDIKTICHSPLKRAKETALILNEILDCPLIEIDFLQECGWGTFEGELRGDRQYLEQWINGVTPVGAETCDNFKERAVKAIQLALLHPQPLIVSHGGVYWALQQSLCKNIYHTSAQNCAAFQFLLSRSNEWSSIPLEPAFDEELFET